MADQRTTRQRDAVLALTQLIVAADSFRMAAASHFDLPLADTYALSYLDAHGPMPQAALARLMGVTSGGMVKVVDRLEHAGTARRTPDPADRRRYRIQLTDRAVEILEQSRARLGRVFDPFDASALDRFVDDLPRLAAGLADEAEGFRLSSSAR